MELCQLVYVSRATAHADLAEVTDLASESAIRNVRDGITGALLLVNGYFVQALEGEVHAVDHLFSTIRRDPRHCDCHVLSRRPIRYREFGSWGMTLLDLYVDRADRRALEQLCNAVYAASQQDADPDLRSLLHEIDQSLLESQEPVVTGF